MIVLLLSLPLPLLMLAVASMVPQVRDESTFKNVIGFCRVPLCGLQSAGTGTSGSTGSPTNPEATPADGVMTGQVWYPMYGRAVYVVHACAMEQGP